MPGTKTAMMIAAILAGVFGIGARKSAVELSEVPTVPQNSGSRTKAASGPGLI
ncbi:hypothetical protein [Hyphomicrobium sulfonivorans]|nr:hypothetical protein [Hyphomicrobium sulfonivorans]MBI1650659.1 hypothetical protein [Hyphomicrobium sulfonivorans]